MAEKWNRKEKICANCKHASHSGKGFECALNDKGKWHPILMWGSSTCEKFENKYEGERKCHIKRKVI